MPHKRNHESAPSKENDAFQSSMTFSNLSRYCDCDECDSSQPFVPQSISEALENYKRHKSSTTRQGQLPMQKRDFVTKKDGISIWRLLMPTGAPPLVEFRNSHRIVFVSEIPSGSTVLSIGKGIIGSCFEENDREKINWKQSHAYLLPSNGGKALGWYHESKKKKDKKDNVVFFMIKVMPKDLEEYLKDEDEEDEDESWDQKIFSIFLMNLLKLDSSKTSSETEQSKSQMINAQSNEGGTTNQSTKGNRTESTDLMPVKAASLEMELEQEDTLILKEIILSFLKAKNL